MTHRQKRTRKKVRRHTRADARTLGAGATLAAGAALVAPASAGAADFTVTTLADNVGAPPAGSLRQAILDANADAGSADRVLFQSGLTGSIALAGELPTVLGPTQILGPGADQITINGGGQHRILSVNPTTAGDDFSISDLTLLAGRAGDDYQSGMPGSGDPGYGGAIYNIDGDVTVASSVFRENSGSSENDPGGKYDSGGGAIASLTGGLTISDSRFIANSIQGKYSPGGGAVLAVAGNVTISGSTFIGNANYDGNGGAVSAEGADLQLSDSVFRANSSNYRGGALAGGGALFATNTDFIANSAATGGAVMALFNNAAPATVTQSTVARNQARSGGGIFFDVRSAVTVSGTTLSENSAREYGGGLAADPNAGPVTIANSTIDENFSGDRGGGIGAPGAQNFTLAISSSTISGNHAEEQGGGIYTYRSDPSLPFSLVSSIVADNEAATGPDLAAGGNAPPTFAAGFSLIENTGTAAIAAGAPNVTGKDPQLAPLADNGGSTQTRLPGLFSPAIDKGNSSGNLDQRGAARPVNRPDVPNAAGGNAADIGAVERQEVPKGSCGGRRATVFLAGTGQTTLGTPRADVIVGDGAANKINGRGGNDLICGKGGKDQILGGAGKDKGAGGAGRDSLAGGGGNDNLSGNAGPDTLRGAAGRDTLKGGPGPDRLFGGRGVDKLIGGPGKDQEVQD